MMSSIFKEDDFNKKMSVKFLQALNKHLPAKRKTLKELLDEERPSIKARDSSTHYFDKKELEKLASMISNRDYDRLRLPIYVEMSSSMERGAIKISGGLECMIIRRILYGNEKPRTEETKDSMIIYYPHLMKIRKELPTTTQFMFTM